MSLITKLAENMDLRAFSPRKPFLFSKANSYPPSSKAKFLEKFIWSPKLFLKASCLLHGTHSGFPIFPILTFPILYHSCGGYMCWLQAWKWDTKRNKPHILPNQIHQMSSSLLIGSAVHVESKATLCYCSVRAICVLWHTEILCWKSRSLKEQQSLTQPALVCLC